MVGLVRYPFDYPFDLQYIVFISAFHGGILLGLHMRVIKVVDSCDNSPKGGRCLIVFKEHGVERDDKDDIRVNDSVVVQGNGKQEVLIKWESCRRERCKGRCKK